MTTINGDHGHAGLRKFNISCGDALPVSIAFTDNPRMIVSGEHNSDRLGGRLMRYHIAPDPASQINVPDAIALNDVGRVVASKDGKWIVIISGTSVMVRNMATDEVVEVDEHTSGAPSVHAVDISPDSTKFATGSQDKTVRIFSLNTGKLLLKLRQHKDSVLGVKFSPHGEYLATAAPRDSIRVWDTRNSYALLQTSDVYGPTPDTDATVQSIHLGWSSHSDRVFTISSGLVTIFQSSPTSSDMPYYTGSYLGSAIQFQDSAPASNNSSIYALATNGRIIAYAAGSSLSFWDTFSSSKIGPTITFQDHILSLAVSSDDSYLACGKGDKNITVYLLRDILPLHDIVDPTSHLPFMSLKYQAFQPWAKHDFNTATSRTLSQENGGYSYSYHSLANYALVCAHSQGWHGAFDYATQSLAAGPLIIGHIALARALVGQGQQEPAFEAFDAVFRTCNADEIRFLLLIKAILLFLSGKRENAITRVKDLISGADDSEKYNCLQVLGNMYLIQGDWKEAFESFERARALSFFRRGHHLMTILLIFGPSFEEREIALRHPLREAGLATKVVGV